MRYNLLILRRGGVSESSLTSTIEELGLQSQINLSAVAHKHHKAEDEKLEAPGQFLRHYSPDIDSYLFTGRVPDSLDISKVVMLDFAGLHK